MRVSREDVLSLVSLIGLFAGRKKKGKFLAVLNSVADLTANYENVRDLLRRAELQAKAGKEVVITTEDLGLLTAMLDAIRDLSNSAATFKR